MNAVEGIRRLTKLGAIVAGLACATVGIAMMAIDVEKTPAEVLSCGAHGDFGECREAHLERVRRSVHRDRWGLAVLLFGTPLAVGLARGLGWAAQGFVKEGDR